MLTEVDVALTEKVSIVLATVTMMLYDRMIPLRVSTGGSVQTISIVVESIAAELTTSGDSLGTE